MKSDTSIELTSKGLGDWFDPCDINHVKAFIEYTKDGEVWPDDGTKPKDVFMHRLWFDRCLQLMALEWTKRMLRGDANGSN